MILIYLVLRRWDSLAAKARPGGSSWQRLAEYKRDSAENGGNVIGFVS